MMSLSCNYHEMQSIYGIDKVAISYSSSLDIMRSGGVRPYYRGGWHRHYIFNCIDTLRGWYI